MDIICVSDWNSDYMGFNMALIARASINNYPINMQQMPIRRNSANSTCNYILWFTVDAATLRQDRLDLVIAFSTEVGAQIGCVNIPLMHFVQPGSVPVQTPYGHNMGFLLGYINRYPPSFPIFPLPAQYPSPYQSPAFQQHPSPYQSPAQYPRPYQSPAFQQHPNPYQFPAQYPSAYQSPAFQQHPNPYQSPAQYPSPYQSPAFQQHRPSIFRPIILQGVGEVISQLLCQGIFGNGSDLGDLFTF